MSQRLSVKRPSCNSRSTGVYGDHVYCFTQGKIGEWWTSRSGRSTPWKNPGTYWIGDWMDPRTRLDVLANPGASCQWPSHYTNWAIADSVDNSGLESWCEDSLVAEFNGIAQSLKGDWRNIRKPSVWFSNAQDITSIGAYWLCGRNGTVE